MTQRWLVPASEIVTVGIPFCVFKLLSGWVALGTVAAPLGPVLIGLGTIDLLLNVVNLVALVAARRRVGPICVAEAIARKVGPGDSNLGLAVDVFLSFTLVAVAIGVGMLGRLPAALLAVWNIAVILNVLGAGVGRLLSAVRHVRTERA